MATAPASAGGLAGAFAGINAFSSPEGQSFSVVNSGSYPPLSGGSGSMGASYSGTGAPLIYQQSAEFTYDFSNNFTIGFDGTKSLGKGFDSAQFKITLNGVSDTVSFNDLVLAELFFAPDFQKFTLPWGLADIKLMLTETLSPGEGFSFAYSFSGGAVPLPASWTMMLLGLACLGFVVAYQRKKLAVVGRRFG
jgi:hypothetical protein